MPRSEDVVATKRTVADWQRIASDARPDVQFCNSGSQTEDYFPCHVAQVLAASTLKSRDYDLNIPFPSVEELKEHNTKKTYLDIPRSVWGGILRSLGMSVRQARNLSHAPLALGEWPRLADLYASCACR